MTRTSSIVVAAMTIVGASTLASAGLTETNSLRRVRSDANASGMQDGIYDSFGPVIYGVMNDDVSSAQSGDQGAFGSGFAYQNTSIMPGSYSGIIEALASADPGDSFDIVDGYGRADFVVDFTVTGTIDYNLSGTGGGFGSINGAFASNSYFAIESISGGSPTTVFLDEDDNYVNFGGSGTLLAGDYQLVAYSEVGVQFVFDPGAPYVDGNASIDFSIEFVPAPSSAALLAFGGVFMTRRRR